MMLLADLALIMLMYTAIVYPYSMIPSCNYRHHMLGRSSMYLKNKNDFKIYFSLQDSANNRNNSSMISNNNNVKMDGNYVRLKGNNDFYNVKLPNGMNIPTLTSKEQQLIDIKEAMQSNTSNNNNDIDGNNDDGDKNRRPSDLDVLREQMRLLLERMSD